MRFGWLVDKFNANRQDAKVIGRFKKSLYIGVASFGILAGSIQYIRESFCVYLKYQALVDQYHHHLVRKASMESDASLTSAIMTKKEVA